MALLSSLSSLICELLQPYITATLFLIDLRNKAKRIRETERLIVSHNKPKKSLCLKLTNPFLLLLQAESEEPEPPNLLRATIKYQAPMQKTSLIGSSPLILKQKISEVCLIPPDFI